MSLTQIYLGLGSNTGRERHLCAGLESLSGFLHDLHCSPVFESQSIGIVSAPFFNLVVAAKTDLPLADLDARLKAIEAENGRYDRQTKGLPLDIDVLLYAEHVGDFAGLVLPRAEILRNAFVLWPLALLAPDVLHPVAGRCFAELWQTAQFNQQLSPVSFNWRGVELTPAALLGGLSSAS